MKKLSEKFLGLFEIIAQPSSHSFTLCLPDAMHSIHPVFHVSQLEPATLNSIPGDLFPLCLLRPCPSPTGPVGPIGSDPESGGQVHGNGCEGFGEVIDQHPEEDAKCLQFTRLRIGSLYQNKLQ